MRGGSEDSKFSQFQIFPKLGTGGGHRISNFSQIQKSPKLPRGGVGGGQDNCGLFPLFGTFFNWNASLSLLNLFDFISLSNLFDSSDL